MASNTSKEIRHEFEEIHMHEGVLEVNAFRDFLVEFNKIFKGDIEKINKFYELFIENTTGFNTPVSSKHLS